MNENITSPAEMLPKLCKVMSSGTKYASAIALTIEACHKALKEGTSVTELEKDLRDIQKRVGIHAWQEIGLDPPSIVKQAAAEYRRDEYVLADFLSECCIIGESYAAGATELYSKFETWYEENISKRVPKQRWFGKQMIRRFDKYKSGTIFYSGVGLLEKVTKATKHRNHHLKRKTNSCEVIELF